jgi:hypothetical protein
VIVWLEVRFVWLDRRRGFRHLNSFLKPDPASDRPRHTRRRPDKPDNSRLRSLIPSRCVCFELARVRGNGLHGEAKLVAERVNIARDYPGSYLDSGWSPVTAYGHEDRGQRDAHALDRDEL